MNTPEIKLGIVGLDGHGPVFAQEVNGPEPKVEGARVVKAMPVPSVMKTEEVLAANVTKTKALGIEIVKSPDAFASDVDGILILHDDGAKHLELTEMFVHLGKPIFVDKPLEANARSARKLVNLCTSQGCSLLTASSLRFSLEMQTTLANTADGQVLSAMTYSPYSPKPTMPGWIYYGIHAVEPLYALMGSGCKEIRCIPSEFGPVAIGKWKDGRMGIAKGTCKGQRGYGFTVWREKNIETKTVNAGLIYPELLKNILNFIKTGSPPVDAAESIEVIAFMEAANKSMDSGGDPVKLSTGQ